MYYKELFTTRPEPIRFFVAQGSNAIPLTFRVMDWTIPNGATCNIYFEKPSGAKIYNAGSIEDNVLTFNMTTQMTAEVGAHKGQLEIIDGDTVYHSWIIEMMVLPSIIDSDAIESVDEFTALTERISQANDAINTMTDFLNAFVEPFQFGAVNMIAGSNGSTIPGTIENSGDMSNGSISWGTLSASPDASIRYGLTGRCTAAGGAKHRLQFSVTLPPGKATYAVSCWAIAQLLQTISCDVDTTATLNWVTAQSDPATNSNWSKKAFVFEKTSEAEAAATISVGPDFDAIDPGFSVCGFQLEKSGRPSAWRPALSEFVQYKDIGGSLPIPAAYGGTGAASLDAVTVGQAARDASGNVITTYYAADGKTLSLKESIATNANNIVRTGIFIKTNAQLLGNNWPAWSVAPSWALLIVARADETDEKSVVIQTLIPIGGDIDCGVIYHRSLLADGTNLSAWWRSDYPFQQTYWTAPAISSGRASLTSGGYMKNGGHVHVSMRFMSTYNRSSTTINSVAFFNGLPAPNWSTPVQCINTDNGLCVPAYINTYGVLCMILGNVAVSEGMEFLIEGDYYIG